MSSYTVLRCAVGYSLATVHSALASEWATLVRMNKQTWIGLAWLAFGSYFAVHYWMRHSMAGVLANLAVVVALMALWRSVKASR